MTVQQPDKIDLMSVDNDSGVFWLSMVEHRLWEDIDDAYTELQAKTNFYIGAIVSGDLASSVAEAKGRTLGIRLMAAARPDAAGMHILSLTKAGCLQFQIPFSAVLMEGEGLVELPVKTGPIAEVRRVDPTTNRKPWWKVW